MELINCYYNLAKDSAPGVFAQSLPDYFLLKRPRGEAVLPELGDPSKIDFFTKAIDVEFDPFADEWRVAPIRKHPRNPFPDRISVGRATNCDIVLRVPNVSKVHAHFHVEGSALALTDNNSANATKLDGKALVARQKYSVHPGSRIVFGSLQFELVDGEQLHRVLTTEARL